MITDNDRKLVVRQFSAAKREALRVPMNVRPKYEALVRKVCEANGISRSTLFNWLARLA